MRRSLVLVGVVAVFLMMVAPFAGAGEAFVKGGYVAYIGGDDDALDLDLNSLIFSGGTDWKLFDYFSIGPEIQYSWKSVDIPAEDESFTFHFLNLYANAKIHLGEDFIRPFVGGGLGLVSATTYLQDLSDTEFKKVFGAQFMGGIVAGQPGGLSFVAEIQFKVPTGDLSDIKSANIMAGIVF